MNDFWKNIARYPRFFISSVTGLILIILTPVQTILKKKKLRIVLLTLVVLTLIVLITILKLMIVI